MARKYNMDGSYTIRDSEGATKVFPDGKRFYMNAAGQKALQEYYKSGGFARVQTGTSERREKYYTGPHFAGGSGWQSRTVSSPTFGYLRTKPFAAPAAKKPAAKKPSAKKPAISNEAKQFRADTMKILQRAEDTRNQFMIDQKKAADQAAARARLEEAARVEREKAAQATAAARSANEARAGRAVNLQIKQAEQQPTTMGTQAFKRRKNQFNVSGSYGGLSKISSGMVNL